MRINDTILTGGPASPLGPGGPGGPGGPYKKVNVESNNRIQ